MARHIYFRVIALAIGWLTTISVGWAAGPAYYSTTGEAEALRTCITVFPVATVCSGDVDNSESAADTDLNGNFATMRPPTAAGSLFPVSLRLGLNGVVPRNYRAGLVIGSSTGVSAVGTIRIRTYLKVGNTVTPKESKDVTSLAGAILGTTTPGRIEFIAKEPFNQVEIEVGALLGVAYRVNVYYAYGIDANVVETARGVVSRFPNPASGTAYSTQVVDNGVTVCVNSNVANPERAADNDLANFATFNTVASVSCPNTLRVKLENAAPRGFYAGFVVGRQGLADLQALGSLRVTTFLNGEPQETVTGLDLLQVTVLPDGNYQVSFPTNRAFDEVQLTRSSLLGALDNLNVYYGFGIEPSAFRDQDPVRSDFASGSGQFQGRRDGVVLVDLNDTTSIVNGERAADANLNNFAVIRTGLAGVLSRTALQVNLNGAGQAGNAAGAVIRQGTGLLNTEALNNITLRTYNAAGQLLETASGSTLLSQALLPNGQVEVYFNTTQDFARVEVEVASTAAVLARTLVYQVFAEDKMSGFPATITAAGPLPVELVAFTAQASGPAVLVAWRTASERNNQYFEIERALTPSTGFTSVGRVAGSGTSNGRSYTFRDETAAATQAPTLYYRLRQVDIDGTPEYSPVVAVSWKKAKQAAISLYPNPATQSSTVRVSFANSSDTNAATFTIYDMRGVLMRQVPAGKLMLQGDNLPAGLYYVVVTDTEGRTLGSERLVVTGQ
ncbi:T9SS type A sorting domain-containing protein [Hymenobacter puniceus]|uniref:T9SS type A sorting domain-containing protein n=1 Tax=Hymenobacter sp. BT190 TaxID=2763505 RepID=UPI0016512EA1|nr:T9SS type A sorting domain-containing protein [Hymenobacter sp. BT190]MBC6697252.1 T9SS type A sorting domain-containing protein [Hymenobacter sp. BT190]